MANTKNSKQVIGDFITYNFNVTSEGLKIVRSILTKAIPPGTIIELSFFFDLLIEICEQVVTQKFPELRDPYTGEPIR